LPHLVRLRLASGPLHVDQILDPWLEEDVVAAAYPLSEPEVQEKPTQFVKPDVRIASAPENREQSSHASPPQKEYQIHRSPDNLLLCITTMAPRWPTPPLETDGSFSVVLRGAESARSSLDGLDSSSTTERPRR
jgi:hypothetical protein